MPPAPAYVLICSPAGLSSDMHQQGGVGGRFRNHKRFGDNQPDSRYPEWFDNQKVEAIVNKGRQGVN